MPKPVSSSDIRSAFLEFFASKSHQIVKSAPIVPPNDPTLMFTNAGMVQFKDVFTGRDARPYGRATSSQKCIRISGKHNDLENVGRTARHHTFFEMLGNFSFGNYFKEDAIAFAWELLTRVYELPPERLVVTVFKGEDGVPADDEARAIWRKVSGFADDRIVGLGMKDNFWSMGETGACGPCSEIYYYHGDDRPDPTKLTDEPTADGRGWVEVWNLVFMQFERSLEHEKGVLTALPAPSIDTGMGLERITGVLQGRTSNYDTDLLRPLVDKAAEIANKRYGGSMSEDDVSMRVIADHARTTAFLMSEGVLPDRTGRAYVLRRVMRRAIRHGHRLGIARPFLHEVAGLVVARMGAVYPELLERKELIASVTEQEEIRFRQTIDRGLKILDEQFETLRARGETRLAGDAAFKLYDTFGFPLDLTEVICEEKGFTVDTAGYERALEEVRGKSEFVGREAAVEPLYRKALALLADGPVGFHGYDAESREGRVVAILDLAERALVPSAAEGAHVEVVLDATPFYGEAGGQAGDHGTLRSANVEVSVVDTQKPVSGLVVHRGKVRSGTLTVGQSVQAEVDGERRQALRRAHSATHLLHYALRRVLGESAQQKGSLVLPDQFRFDFTSGRALTPEERTRVENLVNEKVLLNAPVETEVLPIAEAKKRGAMAIFEEKYGDVVRVLTMTRDSVELCGGTHARATGDIGLFKVVSEGGIAAGVRRIEAVTGKLAMKHLRTVEDTLHRTASAARATSADVVEKVEKLVARERELERHVADLTRKLALGGDSSGGSLLDRAREVAGIKVLASKVEGVDGAALRETAEQLRDKLGDSVVLLAAERDGKVQLVVTVSKNLTSKLRAGELVRPLAALLGGSGGGRPDMAQAGGTQLEHLPRALELLPELVAKALT